MTPIKNIGGKSEKCLILFPDMQLAVSSRSALPRYQSGDIRYVVSLPDPGTEDDPLPLPTHAKKLLQLRFHDVDDIEMLAPQFRKCRAPQKEHVEAIIKFFTEINQAEANGQDQFAILVHCESGLSRSAASAIIGLTCLGYDAKTAFDIVCEANPHSLPNRRMLRIADSIFQNTHLCQIAEDHRAALFDYAGYEDPVKKLDRDYRASLRFKIDQMIKKTAKFFSRLRGSSGSAARKLPSHAH
ncbi:MAG: dual specificity protein phosphatase family protein [Chthoniobacterales bacterium]|nr:dual specificity protein phosphatase family protein [Chthoniobacterales bacterium]